MLTSTCSLTHPERWRHGIAAGGAGAVPSCINPLPPWNFYSTNFTQTTRQEAVVFKETGFLPKMLTHGTCFRRILEVYNRITNLEK